MVGLQEYINNSLIVEMATELSDYIKQVEWYSDQIIENWCLVKWCDNHEGDPKTINRNHWASELKAHLKHLIKIKIKVKNKLKNVRKSYVHDLELNDYNVVYDRVHNKLNEEGLGKYAHNLSKDCANHIEDICEIICGDEEKMFEYVKYPIGFGE